MGVNRSGSPNALPEKLIDKALSNSAVAVFENSPGVLNSLYVENDDASDIYIQFFDSATAAAVTVGTTEPEFSIRVPAGGAWGRDPNEVAFHYFKKGCAIAATTGRENGTAPAVAAQAHVWYAPQ